MLRGYNAATAGAFLVTLRGADFLAPDFSILYALLQARHHFPGFPRFDGENAPGVRSLWHRPQR